MGDQPQPRFHPDERAPGEHAGGGVLGRRQAVVKFGRSAIIPSYADAVRALRAFEEGWAKARAEVAAAITAHEAAVARMHRAEQARLAVLAHPVDGKVDSACVRHCQAEMQAAAKQATEAKEAERCARATLGVQRKAMNSWADWASKVWAAKQDDFDALWRDGEIECFAFPAHDLAATRRVRVPMLDSLEWSLDDGKSARDAAGRLYQTICFYLAAKRSAGEHRVHSIPPPDRAEGEAGEHGLWRDAAEGAEAEATAPEILAEFCAKLPELPRLVAERRRSDDTGSLVFVNHDYEAGIINERRAPLRQHFNQALRAGTWRCFGFSEDRGVRVAIPSPWRDGLSFDDAGGMSDERGRRYSDVLFYRVSHSTAPFLTELPAREPAPMGSGEPAGGRRFRGDKATVWEAAKHRGRPDFSTRGSLARYVEAIARETGVKRETVRNYVTKTTELCPYIESLPEAKKPK
jgi:hypothetical protein